MAEETSQGGLPRPSRLFQIATLPILLLGYGRRRVQASVLDDLASFRQPRGQIAFAVLAVIAVAYPVVASLVHANVATFTEIRNGTAFAVAITPLYDVVYTESLPFMAAAVALGLFSPALGALFVTVFVPADLLAANASRELVNMPWQFPYGALIGRVISYVMLWLLAVEIPLRVRAIGDMAGEASGGRTSAVRVIVARVVAAGVLVFVWVRAVPWVIVPLFTWAGFQQVQGTAIRPTWFYWQVIVGAAAVAALVSAVWSGLPAGRAAPPAWEPRGRSVTSMPEILIRQLIIAIGFALLAAGQLTTITEAAILVGGAILAGPVVTLIAPRVRLPSIVIAASGAVRWTIALGITLALAALLLLVGGPALYTGTYTGLMVVLAVCAVVLRLLLVGGPPPPVGAEVRPPQVATPLTATLGVVTILLLWLALPAIALADDCSDFSQGEVTSCPALWAAGLFIPPLLGYLVGSALGNALGGSKTPPPPTAIKKPGPFIPPPQFQSPKGPPPTQFGQQPAKAPPKADKPGFWDSLFHF